MTEAVSIIIRNAREADVAPARDLTLEAFEEYAASMPPVAWDMYRRNIAETLARPGWATQIVAEHAGSLPLLWERAGDRSDIPLNKIATTQRVSETMRETARRLRREMTQEETILWQYLRASRLGGSHFRRQQIIGKYVVDFCCHAASLVVELDGRIHAQPAERDAEHEAALEARGLLVLRFKNE